MSGRRKSAKPIKKLPGVVDVLDGVENTISGPATMFRVDPEIAARAGFTPQEIELDTSAILQGEPAPTPVVVNDRAYTIRVRFPESTRASVDAIKNTLLVSSTGEPARSARSPLLKRSRGRQKCCGKTCSAT